VPDDRERIAADDLGKADERGPRVIVMVLDDPHRPGPQHVDDAVDQRLLRLAHSGRRRQLDLDPLGGISTDRMRRIERRI
jgi:hypothetical protein